MMHKNIRNVIILLGLLAIMIGCESRADRIDRLAKKFKSGNLYGRYGEKLSLKNLSDEIGIFADKRVETTEMIAFHETEGQGKGFFTGQKVKEGEFYTWSAEKVRVFYQSDLIKAGLLFTEPVYIDYNNKTLPLTVSIDKYGNIVSDVGKGSDDPIYANVDILDKSDIWYCTGMASDIRNQYSKVCAYGVLVGKCAEARANANELLLRDMDKLQSAIKQLKEDREKGGDGSVIYSEEDLALLDQKIQKLESQRDAKNKIFNDLNNAIKQAISYTRNQEAKLAGLIARDIAYVTALSAQATAATARIISAAMNKTTDNKAQADLAEATAKIAEYAIMQYGPTKEIQDLGKQAHEYAKINKAYGKKLMEDANKKLDYQNEKRDMIYADLGYEAEEIPTYSQSGSKRHKKSSSGSNAARNGDNNAVSYIINAGAGFGFVLPGLTMNYVKLNEKNYFTETNFEFGGTFVANFAITFDVGNEKAWSIGPAIQLGYNGQAGPCVGASSTKNGISSTWSTKEWYGFDTIGTAKNAFITDLDFMARYSFSESRRLVLQAGLRMGAVVNGTWVTYEGYSDGDLADEAIFVAGPNIYFGADCVFGDSFLLEYGLRFSAAFGGKELYGMTIVQSYLDFAFEMKFNWQNHIM